jgi:hypothetical protein
VHVHATELAALLNVPLNNIVAVPDTATMMWVEAKWHDPVTLKSDFLMQNPPVGSHCHGQFTGRTLQNADSCGEGRRAKCDYWLKHGEWPHVSEFIQYFPPCLPFWKSEAQTLLLYITRSQKAVLDMLETGTIQQLSDGISRILGAAQNKIMAMATVGVLASNMKGSFESNRAAWDGLARERETWKYMTAVVVYRVNEYRSARQVPLLSIIPRQNATDLVPVDEPLATTADLWSIPPMSLRKEKPSTKKLASCDRLVGREADQLIQGPTLWTHGVGRNSTVTKQKQQAQGCAHDTLQQEHCQTCFSCVTQ